MPVGSKPCLKVGRTVSVRHQYFVPVSRHLTAQHDLGTSFLSPGT